MLGDLVSYVDSNTYSRAGGTKVEQYVMDEGKRKYMSLITFAVNISYFCFVLLLTSTNMNTQ